MLLYINVLSSVLSSKEVYVFSCECGVSAYGENRITL